jgi:hypothetical protein
MHRLQLAGTSVVESLKHLLAGGFSRAATVTPPEGSEPKPEVGLQLSSR